MKRLVPALLLAAAVSANFALPGFTVPAEASKVKCRPAPAPKGLKRERTVQSMPNGGKFQYSDRPGWLYVLVPAKGWVVMKCFGAWY